MKTYVDAEKLQEYTTKLVAKLKTIFTGTPQPAATVADMTDHDKLYVYTGSETGYTAGNLYFWNGTAWTAGGVYNSAVIETDTTLSVSGKAADGKATGDAIAAAKAAVLAEIAPAYSTSGTYAVGDYVIYNSGLYRCTTAISTAEAWTAAHWVSVDLAPDLGGQVSALKTQLNNGKTATPGYILTATENGTGNTWSPVGTPTDGQVDSAVSDWLDLHPEATTTVEDGSLTEAKFTDELKLKTIKDYVTPEMFGAVGDGIANDVDAINQAIATNKVVLLTKKYKINSPINIIDNTRIYGDKIGKRYDQPIDSTCIISGGTFFHSDNAISKCQLLDISLQDTTAIDSGNKVFDCYIERSDFRINGYNIHIFAEKMQACHFENCYFISTIGPLASYTVDSKFKDCYISGVKASENAFLTGTISSLIVSGCYFDFWHYVFFPNTSSSNNIISDNIFDACYRVFTGKYDYFGVMNNVFMRIFDSNIWDLDTDDWAVFSNGLRNYTRSIGNRVDADYYIHTSLTGNNYPNTRSYSGWNSISPRTRIKWNPYPNDSTDLLETRIEELNYKTYDSLQNASLTAGSSERFNHQIVFVNGVCYINNSGTWLQLS